VGLSRVCVCVSLSVCACVALGGWIAVFFPLFPYARTRWLGVPARLSQQHVPFLLSSAIHLPSPGWGRRAVWLLCASRFCAPLRRSGADAPSRVSFPNQRGEICRLGVLLSLHRPHKSLASHTRVTRFVGDTPDPIVLAHAVESAQNFRPLQQLTGIFETCSRSADSGYSKCRDDSLSNLPSLLKDVLATQQGQSFFSPENKRTDPHEWVPSLCSAGNCTVQILHVSPDYDRGLIEGLVTKLGLPATVVYLGAADLSEEIWTACESG
jgi:hypothetical protein